MDIIWNITFDFTIISKILIVFYNFLQNLNFSSKEHAKVKTFHIVKYKNAIGKEISQVLITYITKGNSKIYLLLFDLQDGKCCKTAFIL